MKYSYICYCFPILFSNNSRYLQNHPEQTFRRACQVPLLDSTKEWKARELGDLLQKARFHQIQWKLEIKDIKAMKKFELFASRPIGDKSLQLNTAQQCSTRLLAGTNCCQQLNCSLTHSLPRTPLVLVLDSSMEKSFVSLSVSTYYISKDLDHWERSSQTKQHRLKTIL